MNVTIRPASESDIPFILQVNREINEQGGEAEVSRLSRESLLQDVFQPDSAAYIDIAVSNDISIGLVCYGPLYFANVGRMLWVTQLYTHQDYRKKGIARSLLNHIKTENNKKITPAKVICWGTMDKNKTAQAVFEKIGAKRSDDIVFYSIM